MRLYEFEGKKIFENVGIPVPGRRLVQSASELREHDLSFPVVVKSQVLTGGRGKAGGIREAKDFNSTIALASEILKTPVGCALPVSLLIESFIPAVAEWYVAITTSPETFNAMVVVSPAGGIDIEEVAGASPESILRIELPNNDMELPDEAARQVEEYAEGARLAGEASSDAGRKSSGQAGFGAALREVVIRLYRAFYECDCRLAEINPLAQTESGELVALDAKVILDDNALHRQVGLLERLGIQSERHDLAEETLDERRARQAGFPYVDLLPQDGSHEKGKLYVGLVPGGAGYGIWSIDEVMNISEGVFDGRAVPINFMDSGGGPSASQVEEMFALLMDKEQCDLIITSRFGGISSCKVFVEGLIGCFRKRTAAGKGLVPVYGRMVGTDLASGRQLLDAARRETPEQLSDLTLVSGNETLMVDIISDAIASKLESMS